MNLNLLTHLLPFIRRTDGTQTEKFSRLLVSGRADHERIHRQERRFLVNDIRPLTNLLLAHGSPHEYVPGRPETEITTLYLDTPNRTWSAGYSSVKFRCRSYQDPGLWWFEMKRRAGHVVDKWRRPVAADTLPGLLNRSIKWEALEQVVGRQPLIPLLAVRYHRLAWEWPGPSTSLPDAPQPRSGGALRVTVDREVTFFTLLPEALHQPVSRLGRVEGFIVEIKPSGEVPGWLKGELACYAPNPLSKSKRALVALAAYRGATH